MHYSDLIFFRPVTKVDCIYTYNPIFDFKHMGLKLIFQVMWVLLREELLVINARAMFFLLFFVGIKNVLTAHSQIATTITKCSHPPSQPRALLMAQLRRGGRRQSRKRRISAWRLLSQWRSERSMRRSGREKSEEWGTSWLAGCKSAWCFCAYQ